MKRYEILDKVQCVFENKETSETQGPINNKDTKQSDQGLW